MADIQTNFRAEDMQGGRKVTATPATIAKLVAPKAPIGPALVAKAVSVADAEVGGEA